MSTPPLAFAQTFEGLFLRSLQSQLTPALKSRLRGVGLDLDRPLEPAYPVEVFIQSLAVAANELYPQLSNEEAHQRLGEQFLAGFETTLMGKAMMGLLRVLGPRRALQRMERNFRTGNNYIQTRYEEHSPCEVTLHFDGLYEPTGFVAGIIRYGGQATGARNLKVMEEFRDGLQCRVRVRWDA